MKRIINYTIIIFIMVSIFMFSFAIANIEKPAETQQPAVTEKAMESSSVETEESTEVQKPAETEKAEDTKPADTHKTDETKKPEHVHKPVWHDIKKAAKPIVPEIPEEYKPLVQVFDEYWGAIKKGDYENAYKLESEDYRKVHAKDPEMYKERFGRSVKLLGIRALGVKKINEKEVIIRASVGFKTAQLDTVRFFADRWIKENDTWRHLPDTKKPEEKASKQH
ncbi:MAG: hypothetical protein HXY53_04860 [Nitrospirae bacterium]|nr:hypothetical protein [Nitrospirota bacterium]